MHILASICMSICMSRRTESSNYRGICMLELLMLKQSTCILFVPDGHFSATDIDAVIQQFIMLAAATGFLGQSGLVPDPTI